MALQRIVTTNQDLQLVQDNVNNALVPIQKSPFVGGVLLTGISLKTGSNAVLHTLGRTPTLWVICDINASQTIYRTTWDTTNINLTASGAVTISMWVT